MAVAHAAAEAARLTAGPNPVPSLSFTTSFDGRVNGRGYEYYKSTSPSFQRNSLPVLPSPRLAQSEHFGVDLLSPPTLPLLASASTTDLHETDTNPILSPLQRRATVRQTRSSVNMRFSISAGTSLASSPVGTGPVTGRRASISKGSSPMPIERKPVPSPQLSIGSLGRKSKLRPASVSHSPTLAPGEGFPRLGTPTNYSARNSPHVPFSAHSTPALAQTPSWASLPQPPPPAPPQAPFLERSKTPPALLLEKVRTGFGSPSRRRNAPDRINTNFGDGSKDSGDEAMGMISFFSPISSDEEDERIPMKLPKSKKVWTGDGLIGSSISSGPRPGSRKTTIFSELTGGGGKDGAEGGKKEKKEKKEGKEGGRRRVSGFGAGHFRKFWGGKDEEPKSPGLPRSPGLPMIAPVATPLPAPNPSFLNKAVNRASSPSPFSRRKDKKEEKKDKKEKKEKDGKKDKKEKEIVLPKEINVNITPNSTFSGRVKISNPIPHPDLLQIFPSPTSPKFPPGSRPRGASLSFLTTPLPQLPTIHHSHSASSSTYSRRPSSDINAPSMTSFTSSSTGGNHRTSPLSPGAAKASRTEDQPSSQLTATNQYGGTPMTFPPSPPYTSGEQTLRPHPGHVRSVSAPSTNVNPPRSSSYQYNPHAAAAARINPAGTDWKFPAPLQTQQEVEPLEVVRPYSPGSAQDLLHTLHQSLGTVERTYSHSLCSIAKEISLDERLSRELEAVEKRLQSQTEIIAGIRRQVGERKRRRESKLRREREAEAMASVKENQSESERSYCSNSSSEEEEEADDEQEPEERDNVGLLNVVSVGQGEFVGRNRPLTFVDEEAGESLSMKRSSFTELPRTVTGVDDHHSLHHSSSIPRLSAINRTDTAVTITSITSISPKVVTPTGTPTTSRPPSRNNSLLPKRTSISSPRRRPIGSLARQTFGEEQRKHAVLELRTNIINSPEGSRAPTPASALPRYTLSQAHGGLGLGITAPIPAPTSGGLQSSASSFSFESSDVERSAAQGYHHLPLSATPSQQPSRETLVEQPSEPVEGDKEEKGIYAQRQRLEDKRGMYYQPSASTTSTSLHLTNSRNSVHVVQQTPAAVATYPPPPPEKPTSGHIHFPTPASNNPSRNNSRANTPIPFGPSGLISPPISPPTSSHGRHYRGSAMREEIIRERAMSPEGILMRSLTGGEGVPVGVGVSRHERKAVVEGVELMLI